MSALPHDVLAGSYSAAEGFGAAMAKQQIQFLRSGYVKLPGFLTPDVQAAVTAESTELAQLTRMRDFDMPGYWTPRKLRAAGGKLIKAHSPLLISFYNHVQIRRLIKSIVGAHIYSCSHAQEFMVMNVFDQAGATHGWHFDDPAIALVLILESPPAVEGGLVEYIVDQFQVDQKDQIRAHGGVNGFVAAAREMGTVRSSHHEAGDAYLLRADRCLHRVTPVASGARRCIINMAFQMTPGTIYGETADMLYSVDE